MNYKLPSSERIISLLHLLSHLKWLFMIWMLGLIIYIFFFHPANPVQTTGTVIFLSGIMMGFISLGDVFRISEKEKKRYSDPRNVRRQIRMLFIGVIVLILISLLFFAVGMFSSSANNTLKKDIVKLGYDCLVMMLGFLCLIKQVIEQANYVKSLDAFCSQENSEG